MQLRHEGKFTKDIAATIQKEFSLPRFAQSTASQILIRNGMRALQHKKFKREVKVRKAVVAVKEKKTHGTKAMLQAVVVSDIPNTIKLELLSYLI